MPASHSAVLVNRVFVADAWAVAREFSMSAASVAARTRSSATAASVAFVVDARLAVNAASLAVRLLVRLVALCCPGAHPAAYVHVLLQSTHALSVRSADHPPRFHR
jgi:hypothetical protein